MMINTPMKNSAGCRLSKKAAEKKAEEKRAGEKKAEPEEEQPKRITIAASSEEDLIKQLTSIDWEKV